MMRRRYKKIQGDTRRYKKITRRHKKVHDSPDEIGGVAQANGGRGGAVLLAADVDRGLVVELVEHAVARQQQKVVVGARHARDKRLLAHVGLDEKVADRARHAEHAVDALRRFLAARRAESG